MGGGGNAQWSPLPRQAPNQGKGASETLALMKARQTPLHCQLCCLRCDWAPRGLEELIDQLLGHM